MASYTEKMFETTKGDIDVRSFAPTMTFSDDGIETPNSSYFTKPQIPEVIPSVPRPGRIYKIHLKNSKKLITVTDGNVVLQSPAEAQPGGGWYWVCVEEKNWLGFRNHVSGMYLGRDLKSGLRAEVSHHKAWEYFCVRPHPDGGYIILVYHSEFEMQQIGCGSDGNTLARMKTGGAQWIFEEV